MNKQIIKLIEFLKKMGATVAELRYGLDEGNIDFVEEYVRNGNGSKVPIPSPFDRALEMLVDENMDKIYEDSDERDTGYRQLNMYIDLDKYEIKMETDAQYYGESSDGAYYDLEEEPKWKEIIDEVFEELDYNGTIIISYEGGGDDGYILSEMSLTDIGREVPTNDKLEDIGYRIINNDFSGWEINEGSQGHIYFNKEEINAEHLWNSTEMRECHPDIIIKLNNNN